MSEPITLLIIDSDPVHRQTLRGLLKEQENVKVIEAEATNPESGYHLVNQLKPSIVIFELGNPPEPGLAAVERFLIASPHSTIFVTSDGQRTDTILRAVRAGAQEFLVRPVSQKDLLAAVQRIARQRAMVTADTAEKGKVITLFSCKGGRGTTLIALNLAVALAKSFGQPVAAVDLDLQAGDLSLLFNLKPAYTIRDAAMNMERADTLFLKSLLCDHPSGVSLLAAPQRIEEADPIQPLRISQLLSLLKASFAYIVVDTSPTYDERTLAALDAADALLLVAAPDLASLYHTQRSLDLFDRLAYDREKIKLLLNRCPSPPGNAQKTAEEILERPVFWTFPEDKGVMTSLIAGEPLALGGKNSPLAAFFLTLAARLDRRERSVRFPAHMEKRKGSVAAPSRGLLGLFRRRPFSIPQSQGEEG